MQKTAYDMRISDWSSDVCSSDLPRFRAEIRKERRSMTQTIMTALGPVRLLGENATRIWGMSNAERCRRMAESSAKNGSALADGHELLFNLAYAFDPMLLRLALEEPGTVFAWGADRKSTRLNSSH